MALAGLTKAFKEVPVFAGAFCTWKSDTWLFPGGECVHRRGARGRLALEASGVRLLREAGADAWRGCRGRREQPEWSSSRSASGRAPRWTGPLAGSGVPGAASPGHTFPRLGRGGRGLAGAGLVRASPASGWRRWAQVAARRVLTAKQLSAQERPSSRFLCASACRPHAGAGRDRPSALLAPRSRPGVTGSVLTTRMCPVEGETLGVPGTSRAGLTPDGSVPGCGAHSAPGQGQGLGAPLLEMRPERRGASPQRQRWSVET